MENRLALDELAPLFPAEPELLVEAEDEGYFLPSPSSRVVVTHTAL